MVQSYLGRIAAPSPLDTSEINGMRAKAWHQQGVVVLIPAEVADDWLRQALINEAERKWGKRR